MSEFVDLLGDVPRFDVDSVGILPTGTRCGGPVWTGISQARVVPVGCAVGKDDGEAGGGRFLGGQT